MSMSGGDPHDMFTVMRRPDEPLPAAPVPGLDVAVELLEELLAGVGDPSAIMPTKRHVGLCRICGIEEDMTFEHVPPAAAGNDRRARAASSWAAATSSTPLKFPANGWVSVQRGVGGYVFCGPCNHALGRRVVPAYARLAETMTDALIRHAQQAGHLPGTIDLSLPDWPLDIVARAGLAAVMAVNAHDRLLRRHPQLTDLVLHGTGTLPAGLRLGLTLVVGPRARISAPVCSASPAGCSVFAEAAMQPFAWTLSFAVPPLSSLQRSADVSHWLRDKRAAQGAPRSIAVPVGFLDSPLPGDYRPASDIEEAMSPTPGVQ